MWKKFLIIPLFCLLTVFAAAGYAAEDDASGSSDIDPDTIKENIKRRIEQVARDQKTDKLEKKIAYLGIINSMTPNSISLETTDGNVEQASTSADTVYIETKTSKEVKREDASIGDFVAALGFMKNGVEVLETKRVLILRDPPARPKKTSFFGSITSIDTKKNRIALTNPADNQTKTFSLSTKSQVSVSQPNSLTNQDITIEELNLGQLALVIYNPTPNSASTSASPADTVLIKQTVPANAPTGE